jgi:hypothetical protein
VQLCSHPLLRIWIFDGWDSESTVLDLDLYPAYYFKNLDLLKTNYLEFRTSAISDSTVREYNAGINISDIVVRCH